MTGAESLALDLGVSEAAIGLTLVAGVLLASGRRLVRWEGVVLVVAYLASLPLIT
ncbi:MAG: hypothetical protein ACR2NA_06845 [Solirubrobacterales bacterium]